MTPLNPTQKERARDAIAAFCTTAEANRLKWHYTQARPFAGFGLPPSARHAADCSGYVGLAFYQGRKAANLGAVLNGLALTDPLDEDYSGWGYTGTMYRFLHAHPAPDGKYLVGDIALFGTASRTTHTSVCRKAGTKKTAVFSSNGHESVSPDHDSPNPTVLATYSLRLVGVYRHPALA